MVYLDTSFIAPYYLNEATSSAVSEALQRFNPGQLVLSSWTRTEFASLLARLVRMNELPHPLALEVMRTFEEDMRVSFAVAEPVKTDFAEASRLLLQDPSLGLRSPDALHLAVAANRSLTVYTLDKTFVRAASALGYSASSAGILP